MMWHEHVQMTIRKYDKLKMCITFFVLNPSQLPGVQFLIAFNRDQSASRQTLPFAPFSTDKNIYAGRDMWSGSTWMGINVATGIMAILTNHITGEHRKGVPRGKLVNKFLSTEYPQVQTDVSQQIYQDLTEILSNPQQYSPCSLVVYHIRTRSIYYICNQTGMKEPKKLSSHELYGLCNTHIDDVWLKTQSGKDRMQRMLSEARESKIQCKQWLMERMLKIMSDPTPFPEHKYEGSPIFVNPVYIKPLKAIVMTKCTFLGVFWTGHQHTLADIREITYSKKEGEEGKPVSTVDFKLII